MSAGAGYGEEAVTGDVNAILNAADDCSYEAKEKGRNQVCSLDMMNPVTTGLEAEKPSDLSG
jgi:hypothetical protein